MTDKIEVTRSERCPHCRCNVFSHIDRELPLGGYAPSLDQVRCVDCKGVLPADDYRLSSEQSTAREVEQLRAQVERAREVVRELGRKALTAPDSKTCCEIEKRARTYLTGETK